MDRLTVRLRFRGGEAAEEAWLVTWRQARTGMGRPEVARVECRATRERGSDMVLFKSRVRRHCAHGFVWRRPVPVTAAAPSEGGPDHPVGRRRRD